MNKAVIKRSPHAYTAAVVHAITQALPHTTVSTDPTMQELAHYARIAGVRAASWFPEEV